MQLTRVKKIFEVFMKYETDLVVVIDELESHSGVTKLQSVQKSPVRGMALLERPLTSTET